MSDQNNEFPILLKVVGWAAGIGSVVVALKLMGLFSKSRQASRIVPHAFGDEFANRLQDQYREEAFGQLWILGFLIACVIGYLVFAQSTKSRSK